MGPRQIKFDESGEHSTTLAGFQRLEKRQQVGKLVGGWTFPTDHGLRHASAILLWERADGEGVSLRPGHGWPSRLALTG